MFKLFSTRFKPPFASDLTLDVLSRRRSRTYRYQNSRSQTFTQNHVLIVEDDMDLVAQFNVLKNERNWPLFIAANALEALNLLGKQKFDAMVLDWNLPEVNADRLLMTSDFLLDFRNYQNSQALIYTIPFVTYTSEAKENLEIPSSKHFFQHGHWEKPLSFREIEKRLDNLIHHPIQMREGNL